MNVVLQTPRLLIRPFTPADAAGYFFLNYIPETCWFGDQGQHRLALGRLACLRKSDHAIIGSVGLRYLPDLRVFDIGYRIDERYRGVGYASEACQAMVDYCRQHADYAPVVGLVHHDNYASVRVLEKCGLRYHSTAYSTVLEFDLDMYQLP